MSDNAGVTDPFTPLEERAAKLNWDWTRFISTVHIVRYLTGETFGRAAELLLSCYEAKAKGKVIIIKPGEGDDCCGDCNQLCHDGYYGCNLGLATEANKTHQLIPGPNCPGEGAYLIVRDNKEPK